MIGKPDSDPDLAFHVSSTIDALWNVTLSDDSHFSDSFLLYIDTRVQQVDRSYLGFQGKEKINGIVNSEMLLVIATVIFNEALIRLLIDDENSCNILYEDTLELLNLEQTDLDSSDEEDLIAFNDFVLILVEH